MARAQERRLAPPSGWRCGRLRNLGGCVQVAVEGEPGEAGAAERSCHAERPDAGACCCPGIQDRKVEAPPLWCRRGAQAGLWAPGFGGFASRSRAVSSGPSWGGSSFLAPGRQLTGLVPRLCSPCTPLPRRHLPSHVHSSPSSRGNAVASPCHVLGGCSCGPRTRITPIHPDEPGQQAERRGRDSGGFDCASGIQAAPRSWALARRGLRVNVQRVPGHPE